MPLKIPVLDNRTYQELLNEAQARIPVHNPEWTNFNHSDPGITLLELFAFLTESLLYRANQIPERNRLKFLSLLGLPLQTATPAQGLVTFTNDRGPLSTTALSSDLEVSAGQIPFRTQQGVDVLPVEAQVYFKREQSDPAGQRRASYIRLYTAQMGRPPDFAPLFYETVPMTQKTTNGEGIDLMRDTVDNSLWVALFLRTSDTPSAQSLDECRRAIAGRMLTLGIVPVIEDASRQLSPSAQPDDSTSPRLHYFLPSIPPGGIPANDPMQHVPRYLQLDASAVTDVLSQPGVVEIGLPNNPEQLTLWNDLSQFESGSGQFPPSLADTRLNDRLITWLRISTPDMLSGSNQSASGSLRVRLLWVGINCVPVVQQERVMNELLPNGTGQPDQSVTLARTPIISHSVRLHVKTEHATQEWHEIDDLLSAPPEVPGRGVMNYAPTFQTRIQDRTAMHVFTVDEEAGIIRFGDGIHGARPPYQATLRADYAYCSGLSGNVSAGTINSSSQLPPGFKVSNPVQTWGGADAESVEEGEKQIAHFLQHRDRLVSLSDYATIATRTPGVEIGRVEVLAAYNPALTRNEPGDAPGAVTLMVIPKYDTLHPDAPVPDRLFLDTISNYLDPRRLITTEVFLHGPIYKPVWVSIGIRVVPGASIVTVREAIKTAIAQYLSPLPVSPSTTQDGQSPLHYVLNPNGWPLRKAVVDLELLAVASRVDGVLLVSNVLLAEGDNPGVRQVPMNGLELPHLAGLVVNVGNTFSLEQIRGQSFFGGRGGSGGPGQFNGSGGSGKGSGPAQAGGQPQQPQQPGQAGSARNGGRGPLPPVGPVNPASAGGSAASPAQGQGGTPPQSPQPPPASRFVALPTIPDECK